MTTFILRRLLLRPNSNVELRKAAVVTRLDAKDGRVRAVRYKDWQTNDPLKQREVHGDTIDQDARHLQRARMTIL